MRIAVCVKSVAVVADEVELTADGRAVEPDVLDRALNEWDACAVEPALLMREAAGEGEVVAISVGDDEAEPAVRRALAMGADRGVRIGSTSARTRCRGARAGGGGGRAARPRALRRAVERPRQRRHRRRAGRAARPALRRRRGGDRVGRAAPAVVDASWRAA